MAGCRSLTDNEIALVLNALKSNRDKALFTLGLKSGFRISELLSLRVCDVYQYGKVLDRIAVERRHMKGGERSRVVVLHAEAKAAIEVLAKDMRPDFYLFKSRNGFNKPLSRFQAALLLKQAFHDAELGGKLATHTMRKTFAQRIYQKLDKDIMKTRRALGHVNINNTIAYLNADQEDIDEAVLSL